MERGAWTEERLDDLAAGMREGFARGDKDLRDLRAEMSDGFKQQRAEMNDGFKQLREENATLRIELTGQVDALRQTMFLFGGGLLIGMVVGFISLLAAITANGA